MSFARSLFTVSGLTIVSRIGGFVRDTLIAVFLGAGPIADAFFVAQRLPNLFRSLFAEGAFSAAFVPLYTSEEERHGKAKAQYFAGQSLALLLAVLIPFSALMMMFMPYVMLVLAPGFKNSPEKFDLASDFCTITFPYLTLISITALQTGVLNAHNKFAPGAAAPIAFNIVLIIALFMAQFFHWPIGYALAWGVTAAGVVQGGWLAISCYRAGVAIPFVWPKLDETGKRLFRRVGPGAIGAGAAQVNLLVSTILASILPTGAVSYLFYADRINQLPLGIVGIAVSTTLLPLLSRHVEAGKEDHVKHYISRAIEFCLLFGLPAMLGLVLAAQPIIQTLFEHGKFLHSDTVATATTLSAYAIGIPAFLLVKVFSSGFFARHDTVTPVKIAIIAMIVNVASSLLLLDPMQHVGIALANSIAVWANALLLFIQLQRKKIALTDDRFRKRLPRLLFCSAGMGLITWQLVNMTAELFTELQFAKEAVGLALIIGISALSYALLLQLTGAMRLQDTLAILRRNPKMGADIQEQL